MKRSATTFSLLLTLALILAIPSRSSAQAPPTNLVCYESTAGGSAYDDGWQTGDNDGAGFGPWALSVKSADPNLNGHFVFTSVNNNAGGDTNGDDDIDGSSGRAWGQYANNGDQNNNYANAGRSFSTPMSPGSTFSWDWDVAQTGFQVSTRILNARGDVLFGIILFSGATTFSYVDASGISSTGIALTDEGIHISFELLDAVGNYRATVTRLVDGSNSIITGTLGFGGGVVDLVPTRLFLTNDFSGIGPLFDVFHNNFEICHPEPCMATEISETKTFVNGVGRLELELTNSDGFAAGNAIEMLAMSNLELVGYSYNGGAVIPASVTGGFAVVAEGFTQVNLFLQQLDAGNPNTSYDLRAFSVCGEGAKNTEFGTREVSFGDYVCTQDRLPSWDGNFVAQNGVAEIDLSVPNGFKSIEIMPASNNILLLDVAPIESADLNRTGPLAADPSLTDGHSMIEYTGATPPSDVTALFGPQQQAGSRFLFQVTDQANCTLQVDPVVDLSTLPESVSLLDNYPNPFNPSTTIGFELPEASVVRLTVHDVMGREVQTLVDGELGAGRHEAVWNGADVSGRQVASGIYFYRLELAGATLTKQMVLLK